MADRLNNPLITAVISTRDRGDSVILPLRGILGNDYPNFEAIVVDQSENDLTDRAIRPYLTNPRVRYIRSGTRGISGSRNVGISHARGEWIAMTDDDCEVSKTWLKEFAEAFSAEEKIGVVFGNVLPGRHDPALGFVVSWLCGKPMLARRLGEKNFVLGTSACMGVRRSTWQALGGFDEMLGVGARLKAAEETDFTLRALVAGYYLFETPRIAVTHNSLVPWDRAATVIQGYDYGIGAAVAKHLKCGHWQVAWYYLRLGFQWVLGRLAIDVQGGTPGHRIMKLASFTHGFLIGLLTVVDREKGHFTDPKKRAAGRSKTTP
jgi:glycosyltransferase involved in cell wall biosynthesis